ncbi:SDR family oxidoreductase [Streptomyces sp. NBC_00287]|uniref:SDR family NAD(P)-dependent oxidoreductase n=1 Tax=Streptomyces sp. NBC_00287 TaxID=2975702 RepID=UPI002E2E54EB|nr:SDR family oxidoreductase [Streptomyces sp. NBC_00287]
MTEARAGAPVALVTGSTSGIGEAVARRLAAEGMRVVVNSARSPEAGKELAAELPDAMYVAADIAVREEAEALVAATVERYGRLDVLVNSAGVTRIVPHQDFEGANAEVWREIFDVNVIGTWQMCVAAMPHLRASGDGCVVNVSSVAGVRPAGSSIPYAVSKAALNHMTRLLAAVTGPEVRVNAVAPGLTDTAWTASFEEPRRWMREQSPLQRVGTPEEVAEAVLGMIRSRWTTGEVLLTDGGTHLR